MLATSIEKRLFSQRAYNIRDDSGKLNISKDLISFSLGMPDGEHMPSEAIGKAVARALQRHGSWPLQYGSPVGFEGLLDALVEKLYKGQGIECQRDNLLLTSGGSQALGLLCELFLDPGDVVLTEIPTYAWAIRTFKCLGAQIEGIPIDEDGLQVQALEQKLADLSRRRITPKLLYIIPNFHNPTGLTTTLQRRRRIIELAQRYQFMILEDDAYYDLRFAGEQLPTLYELAGGQNIFYMGTFSKILSAGLRLGWIVGSPTAINHLALLKVDGCTSPFAAYTAYEYYQSGALDGRIQQLIGLYRHRCNILLSELAATMPEDIHWTVPAGGFYTWLTLPERNDALRMLPLARRAGIDYLPGTACFHDGSGQQHIRLAYSYVPEADMITGIQRLAQVIQQDASRQ